MCGIAGIQSAQQYAALDADLQTMQKALSHRGPSSQGHWLDTARTCGLAHTRLAIQDLSTGGAQPMRSACGRYTLVYNGEIYNTAELLSLLELDAATLRGHSDTELVLLACQRWGVVEACKYLNGIFAFAFWDNEQSSLFLARDRFGTKPLYFAQHTGKLIFCSELKALYSLSDQYSVSRQHLAAFLHYGFSVGSNTILNSVKKVLPGQVLIVREGQVDRSELYCNLAQVDSQGFASGQGSRRSHFAQIFDSKVKELDTILNEVIERQRVSDVSLGCFLSGGIDSSLIAAILQSQSERPIDTFTIGFEQASLSEAPYAASVATHLGTAHHELMVTPELLKTVVEQLPLIYDEPFADASQIPTVLLSQMTARHVPVALSGDGGDELFAGYTRHAQAQRLQLLDKHLPARMKAWGANILRYLPPEGWDSVFSRLPFLNQLSLPGDKLYKLSRSLEVSGLQRYSSLLGVDSEIGSIFASPVYCDPCGSLLASWQSVACYQEPLRTQLMDRLVFLPDDVLHKVDRASMAYGLEVRVPLLDSAVLDFADALPSQFNLYAKQTKAPLRQVLAHYAPESLFERPKAGFSVPIASWLRGELKDWAEALLAKDLVLSQGYFDPDKVWALWLQLLEGKGNQHKLVWNILMFQAWLKQWQGSIKH